MNVEEVLKNLILIYAEQVGIKVEINIEKRRQQNEKKMESGTMY